MSHLFRQISLGTILLAAAPVWPQAQPAADAPVADIPVAALSGPSGGEDRMLTPPPVSGADYPVTFATETRSNFLRGGITFDFAHSDNALGGTGAAPVSDNSYSIWPTLAVDQTTARSKLTVSYAPGFTFYQKVSGRDETDQNLGAEFEYRLSPHVTARLRDSFQKSSNAYNAPGEGIAAGVSGSSLGTNNYLIAPVADRLTNTASAGVTYQFAANAMIGGNVAFGNLHYPSPSQVMNELYDTSSQAASVFYNLRATRRQSFGVTYQYQRLLAYPTGATTNTQTNSVVLFYTWLPTPRFSASVFAGPQFSTTEQPGLPSSHLLGPSAGASLNWQGQHTALAASYAHAISGGGGLIGAARADTASAVVRQKLGQKWNASATGGYVNNRVLVVSNFPDTSGHSITASAALEHQLTRQLSVQAGYTRLRQIYRNVPEISQHPDTNREWVTISYLFTKALGR